MDEFEYEEMQWNEWGETYLELNDLAHARECFVKAKVEYLYDQKFVDTLSFIESLPEVK